jgi:hypothetical protein
LFDGICVYAKQVTSCFSKVCFTLSGGKFSSDAKNLFTGFWFTSFQFFFPGRLNAPYTGTACHGADEAGAM